MVVCPVRYYAEYLLRWQNNVHGFLISGNNPKDNESSRKNYVVRLLFGYPIRTGGSLEEQSLSRKMISLWAHFFTTGSVV